jgi:hypothetical protein
MRATELALLATGVAWATMWCVATAIAVTVNVKTASWQLSGADFTTLLMTTVLFRTYRHSVRSESQVLELAVRPPGKAADADVTTLRHFERHRRQKRASVSPSVTTKARPVREPSSTRMDHVVRYD